MVPQPGAMTAHIKTSVLSWGEKVTVSITEIPEGTGVHLRSECSFPLQLFAWGKNKQNVMTIAGGLELPGAPRP